VSFLWLECDGEKTLLILLYRYITEIAPSARRGMLVSMPQFMACTGVCAGYFTCYASVRIESSFSWRGMSFTLLFDVSL
jgi:hypothetical protein